MLCCMCGRYTLRLTPAELAGIFEVVRDLDALQGLTPRYNISPTQEVLVIREEGGLRLPMWTKWGLIPSWSKDAKSAARCINARAETVAEKPSFRAAYKARRCLVPADGYYEWVPPDANPKARAPHRRVSRTDLDDFIESKRSHIPGPDLSPRPHRSKHKLIHF